MVHVSGGILSRKTKRNDQPAGYTQIYRDAASEYGNSNWDKPEIANGRELLIIIKCNGRMRVYICPADNNTGHCDHRMLSSCQRHSEQHWAGNPQPNARALTPPCLAKTLAV